MSLLDWANKVLGTRYPKTVQQGGSDPLGGTGGRTDLGNNPTSFDCSGFVRWVFYKASGGSVSLPAYTDAIATAPNVHPRLGAPQPGDLVLYRFSDPSQPNVTYPHVAIYAGGTSVLQAGGPPDTVNILQNGVNEYPGATFFYVDNAPTYAGSTSSAPGGTITTPDPPPNPSPGPQPTGTPTPPGDTVLNILGTQIDVTQLVKNVFVDPFRQWVKVQFEWTYNPVQWWQDLPTNDREGYSTALVLLIGILAILFGLFGVALSAGSAATSTVRQVKYATSLIPS